MRIIGMDYGSTTLGISISDETKTIATGVETIRYKTMEELLNKVDTYFNKYNIEEVVLGDPKNLDGSISKRCEETYKFKEILENRYNVKVIMEDERLTTVIANQVLLENNTRRDKRKKVVDKLASTIILQGYLDRKWLYGK